MSLQGKRALITGGTRGLGAAVAQLLAERGVQLALNYGSNKDRAQETLSKLPGKGHVLAPGDAFTHAGVDEIVKNAIDGLGGIDIVVSNAGWTKAGNFNQLDAISDEDWEKCNTTNVLSHLWLMQAVEKQLKENKGVFVISSSAAGIRPGGSSMAYSVSKAAANHLTKCLAKATAPNVRVNAVAPGFMATEWHGDLDEAALDKIRKRNALGKVTEIADVARTYLAIIENTSMTAQIIEVAAGSGL